MLAFYWHQRGWHRHDNQQSILPNCYLTSYCVKFSSCLKKLMPFSTSGISVNVTLEELTCGLQVE